MQMGSFNGAKNPLSQALGELIHSPGVSRAQRESVTGAHSPIHQLDLPPAFFPPPQGVLQRRQALPRTPVDSPPWDLGSNPTGAALWGPQLLLRGRSPRHGRALSPDSC